MSKSCTANILGRSIIVRNGFDFGPPNLLGLGSTQQKDLVTQTLPPNLFVNQPAVLNTRAWPESNCYSIDQSSMISIPAWKLWFSFYYLRVIAWKRDLNFKCFCWKHKKKTELSYKILPIKKKKKKKELQGFWVISFERL